MDEVSSTGFSMLSFQPAAYVGDVRRWRGDYRPVGIDDVWDRLEAGLGQPVAWQALQFGDPRCNRTAFGLRVEDQWVPLFDPCSPDDPDTGDRALAHLGGMNFGGTQPVLLVLKLLRVLARYPGDAKVAVAWAGRLVRRSGGVRRVAGAARRGRVTPKTYVVHNFMAASDVAPAWRLIQKGEVADDPAVWATLGALGACTYAMAHPRPVSWCRPLRPALPPRPG